MKILIYGSTYLTEVVCNYLKKEFNLVGYVPSNNPFIGGNIQLPRVENVEDCPHDIKLSIQYDKKIIDHENAYNVHTGLLPLWGGCDIMYHTLKEGAKEQGITFHKMTDQIDYGPIISKITYPIFESDGVLELYKKQSSIAPGFVASSLRLLEQIGENNVSKCILRKPRIFRKRKNISPEDILEYEETGKKLIKEFQK